MFVDPNNEIYARVISLVELWVSFECIIYDKQMPPSAADQCAPGSIGFKWTIHFL